MLTILVVDDNRTSAQAMARILVKQGHTATALFEGRAAIEAMEDTDFDLIFTDLKMEPVDGMEVLRAARSRTPPLEVIVFTAFGAVEHAVEAIQLGARDFLTKPISVAQILSRVRDLTGETEPVAPSVSEVPFSLRNILQAVGAVPSPVWLQGELGSGRREAAHYLQSLTDGSSLTVFDPEAAPPTAGIWLFADVDDYDEDTQAAAARAVAHASHLKLVATSRLGVRGRVDDGTFRSDLYFGLAVLTIDVPPLRHRLDEIPELFDGMLKRFGDRFGTEVPTLSDRQRSQLEQHSWPANLRELRNLAERTAVLGPAGFNLVPGEAPPTLEAPDFGPDFRLAAHLEQIERDLLAQALKQAQGDRSEVGRLLGVERNTLRYKLNKYGLLK